MKGEVTGMGMMTAEQIAAEVQELLKRQFEVEAKSLPESEREALYAVGSKLVESMVAAYVVLLTRDLHRSIKLDQPLTDICAAGVGAIGDQKLGDEVLMSVALTFEAVAGVIGAVTSQPTPSGPPKLAKAIMAGFYLGRADVRRTQVLTGMWNIIAAADTNQRTAEQVQSTRQAGGHARGAELKDKAALWKGQLLPIAVKLDNKHPEWKREKLAQEIIWESGIEEVGHRSVIDWLMREAEQPNGPITSRARKQTAKQASQ
jgi:hypothetical protein